MRTQRLASHASLLFAAALVVGCSTGGNQLGPHDFVSDDPSHQNDSPDYGSGGANAGGGAGGQGSGAEGGGEPDGDPERVIEEADILQLDGNRLYALSPYAGLTIIDVSDPSNMAILGDKKLGGEPFEMYRRDDLIYAMFRSWGHYEESEGGYWTWVTSSHVEVLDVSDPAAIETVGQFDVPGWISDSRMVGDVLYTVSFEDGYCWDCQPTANTTVTSLAADDPSDIHVVDSLTLEDDAYYSWGRSIHVTTDRIYIGAPNWSWDDGQSSTIEVVDISDPGGDLVEGASVPVAGQILNRWQMDERDGVLRVISQPWDSSVNPKVQTYTIESSSSITPLGQTDLVLPMPESLRAVRFDGTRAYAITAQQIDPLFTVDLTDPANPVQRGELEMPGWVYHLEPRGDRLLALGFDNTSVAGSLHVSLFDVADLDNPTMLERIHFGGDWGNFAEDQDRIHKAFKVLPDLGLLLVPYSAWEWSDYGCGGYDSGIQLVDWANDTLVKRGVAPVRGTAKRAFLHNERLFALSDEQVRTFDFADRDNPQKTGELQLSAHVSRTVVVGDHLARLAADWWTDEPRLELVPLSDPGAAQAVGAIDFGDILATAENDPSCYMWSYWNVRLFSTGNTVVLVWPAWNGDVARVATVDVSNPAAPALLAQLDVPVDPYSYGGWYYGYGSLVSNGDTMAMVGDKLLLAKMDWAVDQYGYTSPWATGEHGGELRTLDLSNPAAPQLSAPSALPVGLGHTGFQVYGDKAYFSHWTPAEGMPGKVKFYVDRAVVSASGPSLLPPINVPGSLVSFDVPSGNALTLDYLRHETPNVSYETCYSSHGYYDAWFEPNDGDDWWNAPDPYQSLGTCSWLERTLKVAALDEENHWASLLDSSDLDVSGWVSNLQSGDDRTFFVTNDYGYYDSAGGYVSNTGVWVVGGVREGSLDIRQADLGDAYWAYPIGVDGKTLIAAASPGAVVKVDATNLDALAIEKVADMPWWMESVTFHDDQAFLSLGPWGLAVVDL